nr:uncharacterized protein LOC109182718 [Ipomoea batatas]
MGWSTVGDGRRCFFRKPDVASSVGVTSCFFLADGGAVHVAGGVLVAVVGCRVQMASICSGVGAATAIAKQRRLGFLFTCNRGRCIPQYWSSRREVVVAKVAVGNLGGNDIMDNRSKGKVMGKEYRRRFSPRLVEMEEREKRRIIRERQGGYYPSDTSNFPMHVSSDDEEDRSRYLGFKYTPSDSEKTPSSPLQ